MDETVNAGDIARLVDVGRAAVSNWRKRYDDFPQPVGGTASSPLFSLKDVEKWLRRNGKQFHVSPADRLWHQIKGDDLRLGERVAEAGRNTDPETFEFLYERYAEAHSRRLNVVPDDIAAMMVRLAGANTGTVVADPACGTGTLLKHATGTLIGQELDPTSAEIARIRLPGAEIITGDSLRHNGIEEADAVVCDPPFHERSWGHEELVADPRWTYGLPPRGEPELAWVQHCLSLVKPGGRVSILMPSAAASRRPGRRIRANLLRAGVIHAIITVPGGRDVWLLRRPSPETRPMERILLLEEPKELQPNTRVIDLLDDNVDLSPARQRRTDVAEEFTKARKRFGAPTPPQLNRMDTPPMTTIGELIRAAPGTTRVASPTGTMYEIDPFKLDPTFLQGMLRAALAGTPTGSSRLDLRRTPVPSLPIDEQRRYGEAFRQLTALEKALEEGAEVVRLGFAGLLGGQIGP